MDSMYTSRGYNLPMSNQKESSRVTGESRKFHSSYEVDSSQKIAEDAKISNNNVQ